MTYVFCNRREKGYKINEGSFFHLIEQLLDVDKSLLFNIRLLSITDLSCAPKIVELIFRYTTFR